MAGFSVPGMLAAGVVLRGSLGWGGAQRDSGAVGLVLWSWRSRCVRGGLSRCSQFQGGATLPWVGDIEQDQVGIGERAVQGAVRTTNSLCDLGGPVSSPGLGYPSVQWGRV